MANGVIDQRLIEESTMEKIIRPTYLFLTNVPAGTVFSFYKSGKISIKDNTEEMQVFKYKDASNKIYSFSQFDILSFTVNGAKLIDVLQSDPQRRPAIVQQFTVGGCTIRETTVAPIRQMRPLFAYSGYDIYKVQSKIPGNKENAKAQLFVTPPKPDLSGMYYYTVDVNIAIIEFL